MPAVQHVLGSSLHGGPESPVLVPKATSIFQLQDVVLNGETFEDVNVEVRCTGCMRQSVARLLPCKIRPSRLSLSSLASHRLVPRMHFCPSPWSMLPGPVDVEARRKGCKTASSGEVFPTLGWPLFAVGARSPCLAA